MAWLIRCYDHAGRLLYIASTADAQPTARVRSLRREPWWGFVDQSKVLTSEVTAEALPTEQAHAIVTEEPKYFVDSGGRRPYLRRRPAVPSDWQQRRVQVSALARLMEKRSGRR